MKKYFGLMLIMLAGCATLLPAPLEGERTITIYPQFARRSQAIADVIPLVDKVEIVPYVEVTANSFSPISSVTGTPTDPASPDVLKLTQASGSVGEPFILKKLKFGKKYRIFGRAYDTNNALISEDSRSFFDLPIAYEDRPTVAKLSVYIHTALAPATTSVTLYTDERNDVLRTLLYQMPANILMASEQTTRQNPEVMLSNLQGSMNYRLIAQVYKNSVLKTSYTQDFAIANDNEPATFSLKAFVPFSYTYLAGRDSGTPYGYQDGFGTAAMFYNPRGLTLDPSGNLYVADNNNHCIRRVTPAGEVTTVVGTNSAGYQDGTGTAAMFYNPCDVAMDSVGNLFVTDQNNNRIRKITSTGEVTTFAGGNYGYADGNGTSALFRSPSGIAIDAQDNLYVADLNNHCIRKITPLGNVSTLAGSTTNTNGYQDGLGTSALFFSPQDVAVDASSNVYVADNNNNLIRKIDSTGMVTTYAGNGRPFTTEGIGTQAEVRYPVSVACDSYGNVYFSDTYGLRKICKDTHFVWNTYSYTSFYGLAVDSAGAIYASYMSSHRLLVFR